MLFSSISHVQMGDNVYVCLTVVELAAGSISPTEEHLV